MTAPLEAIVHHCNEILRLDAFEDWPGAVNGLQVENNGAVSGIAAMVDATTTTLELAVREGADLLIVHHGLFWSPSHPWTGPRRRQIETIVRNNLAVYSAHLPLDAHPDLGNNAGIAAAIGLRDRVPFAQLRGQPIGIRGEHEIPLPDLAERLHSTLRFQPVVIPAGPAVCRRIGIISGGAGSELASVAAEGIDTFITGEGAHWTHGLAEDLRINVLYAGHYATETLGVQSLARHVAERFHLPWFFIDHPSGL